MSLSFPGKTAFIAKYDSHGFAFNMAAGAGCTSLNDAHIGSRDHL
jgi:hypothetical protein